MSTSGHYIHLLHKESEFQSRGYFLLFVSKGHLRKWRIWNIVESFQLEFRCRGVQIILWWCSPFFFFFFVIIELGGWRARRPLEPLELLIQSTPILFSLDVLYAIQKEISNFSFLKWKFSFVFFFGVVDAGSFFIRATFHSYLF